MSYPASGSLYGMQLYGLAPLLVKDAASLRGARYRVGYLYRCGLLYGISLLYRWFPVPAQLLCECGIFTDEPPFYRCSLPWQYNAILYISFNCRRRGLCKWPMAPLLMHLRYKIQFPLRDGILYKLLPELPAKPPMIRITPAGVSSGRGEIVGI